MVDFLFNSGYNSELGTKEICEPDSETLTSDTPYNLLARGIQ